MVLLSSTIHVMVCEVGHSKLHYEVGHSKLHCEVRHSKLHMSENLLKIWFFCLMFIHVIAWLTFNFSCCLEYEPWGSSSLKRPLTHNSNPLSCVTMGMLSSHSPSHSPSILTPTHEQIQDTLNPWLEYHHLHSHFSEWAIWQRTVACDRSSTSTTAAVYAPTLHKKVYQKSSSDRRWLTPKSIPTRHWEPHWEQAKAPNIESRSQWIPTRNTAFHFFPFSNACLGFLALIFFCSLQGLGCHWFVVFKLM